MLRSGFTMRRTFRTYFAGLSFPVTQFADASHCKIRTTTSALPVIRAHSHHRQGIAGFPPKVRGYGGTGFSGALCFAAGHVHLSQLLSLPALLLPKGPFPLGERPSLKNNLDVFTIAPRIFVGGGGAPVEVSTTEKSRLSLIFPSNPPLAQRCAPWTMRQGNGVLGSATFHFERDAFLLFLEFSPE